jgi:hypothetical protein
VSANAVSLQVVRRLMVWGEAVRNDPGTVGGNPVLRAPPYGWEVRQTMLGVRARPAAWLAGGLWLLSVGLAVAAALIPGRGGGGFGSLLTLWALANATVGTIVAVRRQRGEPGHRPPAGDRAPS